MHYNLTLQIDASDPRDARAVAAGLADAAEAMVISVDAAGRSADQWCPVCKSFHENVGEQTDAGYITRACPLLPTSDPCYYGSDLYTGDRP